VIYERFVGEPGFGRLGYEIDVSKLHCRDHEVALIHHDIAGRFAPRCLHIRTNVFRQSVVPGEIIVNGDEGAILADSERGIN
jgi:hypothetical protein